MCSIFYIVSDTRIEEETEETAVSSSGIAIYIDSGSGYELSSSSEFPTSPQYTLNTTYSKCTNGGTITQDSETKAISVSVSSSDYCTLYYDSLQRLSDYVISLADTETTPDFSTAVTTDEGVFAMEDDYGTSYYFRGAKLDNYVSFAGFLWQIIRINGDNTTRIILSEEALINGYAYIAFNILSNSSAYVGYMYGDTSSSNYDELHANTNKSNIQYYLYMWYEDTFVENDFEHYLADEIFCNDRSVYMETDNYIYYNAYNRYSNSKPQLTCNQQHDAFTVSDTTYGNGDLVYPVGLVTADELIIAGANFGEYDGEEFGYLGDITSSWTMSPMYFDKTNEIAYIGYLNDAGVLNVSNSTLETLKNKVVINLKADVLIESGDGSYNSPFNVTL